MLELFAFVDDLLDRAEWQSAINLTGIDLKLDPTLNVGHDEGFWPCEIQGQSSGFELFVAPAAELLDSYPSLTNAVASRPHVIRFRWGGDLAECACVLGAALALVRTFQAVTYFVSDDLLYDVAGLEKDLSDCLAEV